MGDVHLRKAESAANEGDLSKATELYLKAIRSFGGDVRAAEARVGLAAVYVEQDDLDAAWGELSRAAATLEEDDDAGALLARALNQMGLVERRRLGLDQAADLHERARRVAADSGDLRQQGVALRNLAGIHRSRGEPARAAECLLESVELAKAEGEERTLAALWRQIRELRVEAQNLKGALAAVREELALRDGGPPAPVANALLEGAHVARLLGEEEVAERWLARTVELRVALKDLEGAGRALLEIGRLFLAQGRPRVARRKLEAARDAVGEQGPIDLRAALWRCFAITDLAILDAYVYEDAPHVVLAREDLDATVGTDTASGQHELVRRARDEADEALTLARQTSSRGLLPLALATHARALGHQGRHEEARDAFRQAAQAADELRAGVYDLEGPFNVYLAYGTWLGSTLEPGTSPPDERATVDYLDRAVQIGERIRGSGGTSHYLAQALGALAAAHHRFGRPALSEQALGRALKALGPVDEAPGTPKNRLRRALERVRARLGSGGPPQHLLRSAEEVARSSAAGVAAHELKDAYYDLYRVQEITKALNLEVDLDRLLHLIIDAGIDLTGAERGFMLLTDGSSDGVAFRVARNMERGEVERPDRKVSNTIARRALEGKEPVFTGNAQSDDRFSGALSVAEQRLKSVCAVPLASRGGVIGVLYLDHRFQEGLFDARAARLLASLADQAAIALTNAQLLLENQSRAEALEAERERLRSQVESQSLELEGVRQRLKERTRAEGRRYQYDQIIGQAPAMQRLFKLLDKVVASTIPVFIHGESGSGKELIARAIHYNSERKEGPFVSENFAAIVDELLESELFGHVKGSFTGATSDKQGIFERANGGTIFLDEVGDLSEKMQKELLRVLEEREVRRVGGHEAIPVDVRVISATHRDLKAMVAEGSFRQDLYYRLHVFALELPPLRERKDDIPHMVEKFAGDYAKEQRQKPKRFEPDALRKLFDYAWPGNVRELRNLVNRTLLLCKGDTVSADEIQFEQEGEQVHGFDDLSRMHWSDAKEAFAKRYLTDVLTRHGGNVSLAARESGMLRQAFQRLIKRHEVDAQEFREG
ncbi:MAG: sigma 54-interacting transcriptional regulator [Planctomycetota bacterium]